MSESVETPAFAVNLSAPLFQEPDLANAIYVPAAEPEPVEEPEAREDRPRRRREERREEAEEDNSHTREVKRTRRRRVLTEEPASDEVLAPKGSTRLAAKRQRRRAGRQAERSQHAVTESEYIARHEAIKREMLVREKDGLNQIAVLEDDVLVEHYVAKRTEVSMVGNIYLGRVQNVLPSMEAAFVDIGARRNAVLYAGEVNWEAAGVSRKNRRIENALKSGDPVLVQVTKDPIGHKGARLTAQITLAGRHLVLVPGRKSTGISRKLLEKERRRLKTILKEVLPEDQGAIVRTAAEGATREQLEEDVNRLVATWNTIQEKAKNGKAAPVCLRAEPELAVRVVRDVFNEDFDSLQVQGEETWTTISEYVKEMSPELADRVSKWTGTGDIFTERRVDEQLAKAFDRKVWLPSGGTLIIDRTEAMTVIDVNTGKFTGSGGSLEETVTKNNLEAAEEIVRQLRLRDIGGIVVVDFIDMVLEQNRDLVHRRLLECLARDRTRHQVSEVTSLGLIQMTRKRVGQGLVEAFSTTCEACDGRGYIIHDHPVERDEGRHKRTRKSAREEKQRDATRAAMNSIAAATHAEDEEKPAEEKTAASPTPADSHASEAKGSAASAGETHSGLKDQPISKNSGEPDAKNARGEAEGADAEAPAAKKPARKRGTEKSSAKKAGKRSVRKAGRGAKEPVAETGTDENSDGKASTSRRRGHRAVVSSGTVTPKSSGGQRVTVTTAAPSAGVKAVKTSGKARRAVSSRGVISTAR